MTEQQIRKEAKKRWVISKNSGLPSDHMFQNYERKIELQDAFIEGGKFVLDALKDKNLLFKMIHDIEMEALNTKDDEL